jgi:hypothetical protein
VAVGNGVAVVVSVRVAVGASVGGRRVAVGAGVPSVGVTIGPGVGVAHPANSMPTTMIAAVVLFAIGYPQPCAYSDLTTRGNER